MRPLLSQWPLAREIIAANREFLATRARVRADARRWLAEDRGPDLLLPPGKRLAEAEDVLLTRREEVDDKTIGYIEASISAQRQREEAERVAERQREEAERKAERQRFETEEAAKRGRLELEADAAREREAAAGAREAAARRLAQRTRIAAVLTLVLAIAAVAGAIVGFRGQQEATRQAELAEQNAAQALAAGQEAERQAVAAVTARDETLRNQSLFLASLSAQRMAAGDTKAGILLALEALPGDMAKPDRPYVVEAEAALYQALFARREIAVLRGHQAAVRDARFSPQGDRIVTASFDHTARVWNAFTGEEVATFSGHDLAIHRVVFNPDGNRVATASPRDKSARIWDATTGREIAVLEGYDRIWAVAFSPDGTRVVTAGQLGAQVLGCHHRGSDHRAACARDCHLDWLQP